MAKPQRQSKVISNRRARFDYDIEDTLKVGVVLNGAETKATRMGHASLRGAYVNILSGELWLINAAISGTSGAPILEKDQTRTRKLLAKKSEIKTLIKAKEQGLNIVPLEIINDGRYIKVRIATGKSRKNYDKRHLLKERDETRKIQRFKINS